MDGKEATPLVTCPDAKSATQRYARGIPDPDWKVGNLKFVRPTIAKKNNKRPNPFSGSGATLRD